MWLFLVISSTDLQEKNNVLHRQISSGSGQSYFRQDFLYGTAKARITPILPQWDLGIVLEASSKSAYEPLWKASLKHLTYKSVFLLAIASAGRLQALVFDSKYIQLKPKG